MTHHEGDGLVTQYEHQIVEPISPLVAAPVPLVHQEAGAVYALPNEETLKTPVIELSHASSVIEDGPLYVSLSRGLLFS